MRITKKKKIDVLSKFKSTLNNFSKVEFKSITFKVITKK